MREKPISPLHQRLTQDTPAAVIFVPIEAIDPFNRFHC